MPLMYMYLYKYKFPVSTKIWAHTVKQHLYVCDKLFM